MVCLYVISEWRLTRPVEINQYDITMATHYDITMGIHSNVVTHCNVIMSGNSDVILIDDVAMCTYHHITKHNDVDVNLFYYVFSALCLIIIL